MCCDVGQEAELGGAWPFGGRGLYKGGRQAMGSPQAREQRRCRGSILNDGSFSDCRVSGE